MGVKGHLADTVGDNKVYPPLIDQQIEKFLIFFDSQPGSVRTDQRYPRGLDHAFAVTDQ